MAGFVEIVGPVACFGFARSIGPAIMFSRSPPSPELLLSSSMWDDLAIGDFGGDSVCLSCLLFSGGALNLFFGAGGGGDLLVLFSALVSAIAISTSLRCAFSRSASSSCFLSRSSSFFFFSPEVPEVSGQFSPRLFGFFVKFSYSDVFLLFFALFLFFSDAFLVEVFLALCAKLLFCSCSCAPFFSFSASSPLCFS